MDSLFHYHPNKGAAIAFSILFFLSAITHCYQCHCQKSWRWTGFLPWGTLVLTSGFVLRAVAAWKPNDDGIYIATQVLLVTGPPIIAAALYVVLGRTMYFIPWLAPMHPGRVMTTFIGLDVICELILGAGAPRAVNSGLSRTERNVGLILLKTGLIFQAVLLVAFLILTFYFYWRATQNRVAHKIRGITILISTCALLILERSILRTVEMFQGRDGTVYRSEPIFYTLEASVMLVVVFVLNIWHPTMLLPTSNKIYLSTDGHTEREGPGWVDRRPMLQTIFDPFDLASMCSRRKSQYVKFWEAEDKDKDGSDGEGEARRGDRG